MTASGGDLMLVLDFNEADLLANRSGRLSAAQSAQLKRNKRRIAVIAVGLFFTFVMLSTALIYLGQSSQNAVASVGGLVLILTNALAVGILGRQFMRLDSDQRSGKADALAGEVERVIQRGRRNDRYLLRIDGEGVYVKRETFECFEHKARYRIYRTQVARDLLSAELLA